MVGEDKKITNEVSAGDDPRRYSINVSPPSARIDSAKKSMFRHNVHRPRHHREKITGLYLNTSAFGRETSRAHPNLRKRGRRPINR
jgi:hypothetical protein